MVNTSKRHKRYNMKCVVLCVMRSVQFRGICGGDSALHLRLRVFSGVAIISPICCRVLWSTNSAGVRLTHFCFSVVDAQRVSLLKERFFSEKKGGWGTLYKGLCGLCFPFPLLDSNFLFSFVLLCSLLSAKRSRSSLCSGGNREEVTLASISRVRIHGGLHTLL